MNFYYHIYLRKQNLLPFLPVGQQSSNRESVWFKFTASQLVTLQCNPLKKISIFSISIGIKMFVWKGLTKSSKVKIHTTTPTPLKKRSKQNGTKLPNNFSNFVKKIENWLEIIGPVFPPLHLPDICLFNSLCQKHWVAIERLNKRTWGLQEN